MEEARATSPLRISLGWTVVALMAVAALLVGVRLFEAGAPVVLVGVLVAIVVAKLLLVFRLLRARAERQRARAEEAESLYRELFESAPVGIFRTHSSGKALNVNPALAEMLGFSTPEEAVAHYVDLGRQLYADADRRREFLQRLRRDGSVQGFTYRAVTRSGREAWLEMDAVRSPVDEEGHFAIEGFCWEITARRETEETVRRQRAMLERTERLASIGSWEMDRATGHVTWSREMFEIMGVDPSAGEVPSLEEQARLFSPEDWARLERAVERAWRDGRAYDMELEVRRPDGDRRVVRARGFPETSPSGARTRLYGFAMDITHQVRAAEEERALRRQLLQAQKMESVGRLAGGIAHDFNNMLSVILGNVELALGRVDGPPELLHELRDIETAAARSARLTRQLLAFARKQVIRPRVVELNEVVEGSLSLLRRLVSEDVDLQWLPGADAGRVRLDPGQLEQVLMNLLANARDSMQGGGTIVIETRAEVEGPGEGTGKRPGERWVSLAISDDGCGMSPDTLPHIFEPFFTTKALGEGTGLGLAMVHGVVKQHRGHIHVDSEPGRGTTFTLRFPTVGDEAAEEPEEARTLPSRAASRGERVLLVEDEPEVMELTEKFLRRLGYSVRSASSPEEALALLAMEGPHVDLLLTDVVLPGMSGRDLARRLQAHHPDLPTVYISGHSADVLSDRGVLDNGLLLLQKPFSLQELDRVLSQALARS